MNPAELTVLVTLSRFLALMQIPLAFLGYQNRQTLRV
jgi:hypothetical protein